MAGDDRKQRMMQYRISLEDHLARPWMVHELLADLAIEDVWQFPVRLRPGDSLADFRREMTAAVGTMNEFGAAALLFRLRLRIGRLLDWDRRAAEAPPRQLYRRFLAAHPDVSAVAAVDESPFSFVYSTADEYLGEIENRTVLAAVHLGRVEVAESEYVVRLAVYVAPKGRLGRLYMALIKPFRLWVVYPAIMEATARAWREHVAANPPPD